MDANNHNTGDEGTPSKKHAIEESPRKPSPAKKPKVQQQQQQQQSQTMTNVRTGDKPDINMASLENRIARLEGGVQKRIDVFRKKLHDQRAFFISEIDKKVDLDVAMNDKEHESFITDITKTATRAYLHDILEDQVKNIVDDLVEDILYKKLAERDAVLARLVKDRDAAIKGMLKAKADQLELDEELAAIRCTLEQQRRQIVAIWDWIRTSR